MGPEDQTPFQEEKNAVISALGGRQPSVLYGIGAWHDVGHCFEMGYPERMELFDIMWQHPEELKQDIESIKPYADNQTLSVTTGTHVRVSFAYQGKPKSIGFHSYYFDHCEIERKSQVILHNGHAGVDISQEQAGAFEMLGKGALLVNVFLADSLIDHIVAGYFFEPLSTYTILPGRWGGPTHGFILCRKDRDIREKEIELISNFADLCGEVFKYLERAPSNWATQGLDDYLPVLKDENRKLTDQQRDRVLALVRSFKTVNTAALGKLCQYLHWH